MKRLKKHVIHIFICLMVMLVCCLPLCVFAAEPNFKVTILYQYDETEIPGAEFRLYRVGEIDAAGDMYLTGVFEEYPVDVNYESGDEMQMASDALYGYIVKDQIDPDMTAITNDDGYTDYTGLEDGLYLLAGQTCTISGVTYISQPQLLALPESGKKHITINIKCSAFPESGTKISLKVLKDWADEGHTKERPKKIKISLLKDGAVFDTVTLDKANRWRYIWTDMDAAAQWMVTEEPVDGYTVTVRREGKIFLVVNTYDEEDPEDPEDPTKPGGDPENPTKPTKPDDDEPDEDEPDDDEPIVPGTTAPSEPGGDVPTDPSGDVPTEPGGDVPTEPGGDPDRENPTDNAPTLEVLDEYDESWLMTLPQTGMNWWPAIVCVCGGMVLILVGLLLCRRNDHE